MCMRASFENFGIFTKLLFLSIFCRYIRYFVGTNDMLVGLHVPTNFQMYRQKSEKALMGAIRTSRGRERLNKYIVFAITSVPLTATYQTSAGRKIL